MNDEKYDYNSAVRNDIREYLKENYNGRRVDRSSLYDDIWTADTVTGNASGSYTFNTWKAESFLCHNTDLLIEAFEHFDESDYQRVIHSPEFADVTIRLYVADLVIDEEVDRWNAQLPEDGDEDGEGEDA